MARPSSVVSATGRGDAGRPSRACDTCTRSGSSSIGWANEAGRARLDKTRAAPTRIWHSFLHRFTLDDTSAPPLSVVQRFVHHYVAQQLGGSDLMATVRKGEGKPVVGNASDANPFLIGISTKKLLREADRDQSSFLLHLNATYKLTQIGYPVVVVGISDQALLSSTAIVIVSQQQEEQYTELLGGFLHL
ncbi:unnamed protein product [Phytophthora fragariaefolia]|uniref:Unnamed protein product n=1 Tax=Phytophthora fragariaefolia TaxID=1490495 RepID=A0A9W6XYK1_9STRA|nr:unnamed protein product [Phytophthora fragariaefolia]